MNWFDKFIRTDEKSLAPGDVCLIPISPDSNSNRVLLCLGQINNKWHFINKNLRSTFMEDPSFLQRIGSVDLDVFFKAIEDEEERKGASDG